MPGSGTGVVDGSTSETPKTMTSSVVPSNKNIEIVDTGCPDELSPGDMSVGPVASGTPVVGAPAPHAPMSGHDSFARASCRHVDFRRR